MGKIFPIPSLQTEKLFRRSISFRGQPVSKGDILLNDNFPRILTLLRKENGVTQKQAAAALGVSQALLSHYENGIRECGLDFVVRAAEYYGVSCDYLLGRTPTPTGSANKDGKTSAAGKHDALLGAVRMLLSMADRIGCEKLSREVEGYLTASVYRLFRKLYRVHPRNESGFFTIPEPRAELKARCRIEETATETEILVRDSCGEKLMTAAQRENGLLTTDILISDYGEDGSAMLLLVREEEEALK